MRETTSSKTIETIDGINAESLSQALKTVVNNEGWFYGKDFLYRDMLNKEFNYEYYAKRREGFSGIYDIEVAVLIKQSFKYYNIQEEQYYAFALTKSKYAYDDEFYTSWHGGNIDVIRYELEAEGYDKLGESKVFFSNIEKPDYCEDS